MLRTYDNNATNDAIFDYKRNIVIGDNSMTIADTGRSPDVLPKDIDIDVGAGNLARDAYVDLVTLLSRGKGVKWSDAAGAPGLPNAFYHNTTNFLLEDGQFVASGSTSPDARFGTDLDFLVKNAPEKASRNIMDYNSLPTEANPGEGGVPNPNSTSSPYVHFLWTDDMIPGVSILVVEDYNSNSQKTRNVLAFNSDIDYSRYGNFKMTAGIDSMEAWLNTALDSMTSYSKLVDANGIPGELTKALLSGMHWQGAGHTVVDHQSEQWDVDRYNVNSPGIPAEQQTQSEDTAPIFPDATGVTIDEHAHQMNGQFVDNYLSKYCPKGSTLVTLNGSRNIYSVICVIFRVI